MTEPRQSKSSVTRFNSYDDQETSLSYLEPRDVASISSSLRFTRKPSPRGSFSKISEFGSAEFAQIDNVGSLVTLDNVASHRNFLYISQDEFSHKTPSKVSGLGNAEHTRELSYSPWGSTFAVEQSGSLAAEKSRQSDNFSSSSVLSVKYAALSRLKLQPLPPAKPTKPRVPVPKPKSARRRARFTVPTVKKLDPSDLVDFVPTRVKLHVEARRQTMAKLTGSLTKLNNVIRLQRKYAKKLADLPTTGPTIGFGLQNVTLPREEGAIISAPTDAAAKAFAKDFYRRMEEAAEKRRSLKLRRHWMVAYRKIQSVLRICRNMAERTWSFEVYPPTYVDIGDGAVTKINYGEGRSVDTEYFKRKKEITICSLAKDILLSDPDERTLIQVEDARRELQVVEVFSKYPIKVQERLIRRAFYMAIGPKRIIIRQDHTPYHFYIIICGEAYAKEREWDEASGQYIAKATRFMQTGETFGATALMTQTLRASTVISRTNMQLLAIHGEDYTEVFLNPTLSEEPPPHLVYLSGMTFMENFPLDLIKERISMCALHHFRPNTVITRDSHESSNLFIIKYGYCKVFRKVGWVDRSADKFLLEGLRKKSQDRKRSQMIQKLVDEEHYFETKSPYVTYIETQSPAGNIERVPVTKIPRNTDKLQNLPLTLPRGKRQFVPLMILREGEVFGLDQTPLCPHQKKSKTVILVSLGAEVIALNKTFYCRHASREGKEVAEKTFIYDDAFIQRRLKVQVNRDVHLEEVLSHYFAKVDHAKKTVSKRNSDAVL